MATINDLFGVLGRPFTQEDLQALDPLAMEVIKAQMPVNVEDSPFYLYGRDPKEKFRNLVSKLYSSYGGSAQDPSGLEKRIANTIKQIQSPLTMDELEKTPGYLSRLRAGSRAVDVANRAKGIDLSGPAQKELERYGQTYAAEEYANEWQRRQAALQTKLNKQLNKQQSLRGLFADLMGNVQQQTGSAYQQQLGQSLQNLGLSQDQLARVSGMLQDIFNRYGVMSGIGQQATTQLTGSQVPLGTTAAQLTANAGQSLAQSQMQAYQQKASGLDSMISDLIGAASLGAGIYGKYFYTPPTTPTPPKIK